MEAIDELTGPKDHTYIVKGKRTKRQRPQSPIPFTIAANSSSGDGGGGYGSNGDMVNNNHQHETNYSSPATSGEFIDSATEEEEDMANCLILLAQGGSSRERLNPKEDEETGPSTFKFTSKRYLEAPSSGNGKVGMFVYQCKTCSRTFPSFQALGGHRASHKKPKVAASAAEERKRLVLLSEEDEPLSLQLSNKGFHNTPAKFKVHECSICGAEFSSGQALGGHMRRHRGPSTAANTTLSLSPTSPTPPIVLEAHDETNKVRNVLSLDLNLPAPEDDHLRDPKVGLASKQPQQSPLVFSATPALVDCQY